MNTTKCHPKHNLHVIAWLVGAMLSGCDNSQPDASRPTAQEKTKAKFDLVDLSARWKITSKGLTSLEGQMWVPEVKSLVKNTGTNDIDRLYLRAVFLDEKGVITSEAKEAVESVPAGYSKGPVFIHGSVGYRDDMPFLSMVGSDGEKNKWKFDLFSGESYSGPWTKIRSGTVSVPEQLESLFKKP